MTIPSSHNQEPGRTAAASTSAEPEHELRNTVSPNSEISLVTVSLLLAKSRANEGNCYYASCIHFNRETRKSKMAATTLADIATGRNQLNAVSQTTFQSVPFALWKIPPGLRRQSNVVIIAATNAPSKTPEATAYIACFVVKLGVVFN